jgi:hypothetical protein
MPAVGFYQQFFGINLAINSRYNEKAGYLETFK